MEKSASRCAEVARAIFGEVIEPLLSEQWFVRAKPLAELARRGEVKPEGAREAMDSPKYQARVDTSMDEGHAAGVSGTPTVLIGNVRLVGAQPYEAYAEAARRAGARPRS